MSLEILTGLWSDLKAHLERHAVFLVHGDLDLREVSEKVAADDAKAIALWIEENLISRPTPQQTDAWDETPSRTFRFAIVQPYVLIQELGH